MTFQKGLFKDQIVVVTGGGSGIGRKIAETFAKYEAKVYVLDKNLEKLTDLDPNLNIIPTEVDVSKDSDVDSFFSKIEKIDVLVNCAGFTIGKEEFTSKGYCQVMDVNINGSMRTCYAGHEALKKSKHGAIINTSSMLAIFGSNASPAYSSKGAINQLTKSLAIKYGAEDIRVNAVAPGWIKTPLLSGGVNNKDFRESIFSRTPLARFGETNEIANVVIFLASEAASWVNGAIVPIDGGYSIM
ncbi:MAG TPA: SDR family oxidoreductase [Candidatus Ligilactobacillus excrementavium]|nr:SDR family oxidoreductase [Candidatus Ligilactobacillus excrementavium]